VLHGTARRRSTQRRTKQPGSLYQEPETRRRVESKTFLASSEFWVMVGAVVALFVGAFEALSAVRGDRTG
jgi:hypothetical protein